MHFEVRVLTKLVNADEHTAVPLGFAQLGAAVRAFAPDRGDARGEFLGGSTSAQWFPEVDPRLRVQAEVPEAVGRQAAAVAAPAERRRGRSDDSKNGAVGQREALRGRGRILAERRDLAVALAEPAEHFGARENFLG